MEGCKKMNCDSSTSKLMSKFLLICSIFNVMALPICVCGLAIISKLALIPINEPPYKSLAIGFLCPTIVFILTGILGVSASYRPTRSLIISALVFSSLSIGLAFYSAIMYGCEYSIRNDKIFTAIQNCRIEIYNLWRMNPLICSDLQRYQTFEHAPNTVTCRFKFECDEKIKILKIGANVLLFKGITVLVSMVNNIVITVLWSKNIFKCNCDSIDSSIAAVHPPGNLQQQTPNWAIPLTGKQQQQFQSYSTAVADSQQQTIKQQEQQSASALSTTMKSDEPMNLTSDLTHLAPPPPYSTVAKLQPQMK